MPIAHSATATLNHYDRYFFNGYSTTDGSCTSARRWACTRTATWSTPRSAWCAAGEQTSVFRSQRAPAGSHATPPTLGADPRSRSSSRCTRCASWWTRPSRVCAPTCTFERRSPAIEEAALLPARRRAHVLRLHPPHPVRHVDRVDRARRRAHRRHRRRRVGFARPLLGRAPGRRAGAVRRTGRVRRSSSGCGRR